jgi:hypothetical protein
MLLLVGANNAQGASVCQGNFDRPLSGEDPALSSPLRGGAS